MSANTFMNLGATLARRVAVNVARGPARPHMGNLRRPVHSFFNEAQRALERSNVLAIMAARAEANASPKRKRSMTDDDGSLHAPKRVKSAPSSPDLVPSGPSAASASPSPAPATPMFGAPLAFRPRPAPGKKTSGPRGQSPGSRMTLAFRPAPARVAAPVAAPASASADVPVTSAAPAVLASPKHQRDEVEENDWMAQLFGKAPANNIQVGSSPSPLLLPSPLVTVPAPAPITLSSPVLGPRRPSPSSARRQFKVTKPARRNARASVRLPGTLDYIDFPASYSFNIFEDEAVASAGAPAGEDDDIISFAGDISDDEPLPRPSSVDNRRASAGRWDENKENVPPPGHVAPTRFRAGARRVPLREL